MITTKICIRKISLIYTAEQFLKTTFILHLAYFIENLNTNSIDSDENNIYFILNNEKNRSDNLGLFGSLEYYFKITEYAELGVKGKLYYSLNGIETIALLPTLRVKL